MNSWSESLRTGRSSGETTREGVAETPVKGVGCWRAFAVEFATGKTPAHPDERVSSVADAGGSTTWGDVSKADCVARHRRVRRAEPGKRHYGRRLSPKYICVLSVLCYMYLFGDSLIEKLIEDCARACTCECVCALACARVRSFARIMPDLIFNVFML